MEKSYTIGTQESSSTSGSTSITISANDINTWMDSNLGDAYITQIVLKFKARKTYASVSDQSVYLEFTKSGYTTQSIQGYKDVVPNKFGLSGIGSAKWSEELSYTFSRNDHYLNSSYIDDNGRFIYNLNFRLTGGTDFLGNKTYWQIGSFSLTFSYTPKHTLTVIKPQTTCEYISIKGVDYTDTTSIRVIQGDPIPIFAGQSVGYKWNTWDNGDLKQATSIVLNADITVTPNFIPIEYTLIYEDGSGNQAAEITLKYDEKHKIEHFDTIFSINNYPTWNLIYNDNGATEYFIDSEPIKRTWHNRWRKEGTTTDYGLNQEVSGLSSTDGDTVILQARWKAEAIKTNLSIPIRKYHQFAGWRDSSGNIYNQGDNFILTVNNSTLTAQWEKIQPRMFAGIDNIQKLFLSKDKEIKKIFVYINGSGAHIEV